MEARKIKIFDTTLRDGEQSPGASMSLKQKIEMGLMLESLGVDRIEAGFPISSEVQFKAVKELSKRIKDSTIVGLSRCVKSDIDAVYESTKSSNNRMIHLFIATSPIHRKYKLKMKKGEILDSIRENLNYAKKYFDKIEFSPEDATRTETDFLLEVIRTAIQSGATTINIPDTVGYTIPIEFSRLIKKIKKEIPEINNLDLSVHCHNDLGLAVSNSISALLSGANQVEVTVNGIGERAGNCSLEELVMAIETRRDILNFKTNIKTNKIYSTSKLLESLTGLIIQKNKPIVGENAFLHEAGIHQHGVINNRSTYEIMKPEKIGRGKESLVMGRHSGKHSFKEKLELYDIKLSREQFDKAFKKFQIIADKKKEVFDEDIFIIVSSVLGQLDNGYKLEYYDIKTGNKTLPSATIKIKQGKSKIISTGIGNGPVDAIFNAIDSAIKVKTKLEEYTIYGVGSGRDAQGQVRLVLNINNKKYSGRGNSTDIIEASAYAYINAINKYELLKNKKNNQKNNVGTKIKEVC